MARFDYVKYDPATEAMQKGFKTAFESLTKAIEGLPSSRASSLALTKLEEAYMWIGKALRDLQVQKNGSAPAQEERKNG